MTLFEVNGVDRQVNCSNEFQARKQFRRSCEMCCARGLYIDCDCCAIRAAHEAILESFVMRRVEAAAQKMSGCKKS